MQVDEEAMYSMRNNLHASGCAIYSIYMQVDDAKQSTCKKRNNLRKEAMYSMRNNLHASG